MAAGPGWDRTGRATGRLLPASPRTPCSNGARARLGRDSARGRGALVADPAHRGQHLPELRFAMLLMWGPELVMVYNDAYAPTLGNRHPDALGRRVAGRLGRRLGRHRADDRRGLRRRRHVLRGPAADDDPARLRGGVLLHLLLQPGRRARRAGRRAAQHRRRDHPAGAGRPPDGRAAAAGQPAALGARRARPRRPRPRSRCWPTRAPTARSGSSTSRRRRRDARLVAGHGIGSSGGLGRASFREQVREAIATGATSRPSPVWPSVLPGLCQRRRQPGRGGRRAHRRRPSADRRRPEPARSARWCSAPARTCGWTTSTAIFLSLAAGQVAAAVADAQAVEAERRRADERAELDRARAQFFTEVAVTLQRAVLGPDRAAGGVRRPLRAGHRHARGRRRLVRRRRPARRALRRRRRRRRRPRAGRRRGDGPAPQRRPGAAAGEPLPGARALRAGPVRRAGARRRRQHGLLRRRRPARRHPPVQQRRASAGDRRRRRRRSPLPGGGRLAAAGRGRRTSTAPRPTSSCRPARRCCSTPTAWSSGATRRSTRGWPAPSTSSTAGRHLPPAELAELLTEQAARRRPGRRRRVPPLPPRELIPAGLERAAFHQHHSALSFAAVAVTAFPVSL